MPNTMDFNFDQALVRWRQQLRSRADISAEYLNELESSLHDHYEAQLLCGATPARAFALATERVSPPDGPRATSTRNGIPVWWMLLPNQLKLAWRNLRRRAGYGLVNFVCLATGMLTVTLAVLYLDYETNFDSFIPDVEHKYRVGRTYRSQGYSVLSFPDYFGTSGPDQLAQLNAYETIPGIKSANQFFVFDGPTYVRQAGERIPVEDILQTNTPGRFLDFFDWRLLRGSRSDFTEQPNQALLTETFAGRLFGPEWRTAQIIGQPIRIDTTDFTIAGVMADPPANAHFDFTIALHVPRIDYWCSRLYLELVPGAKAADVTQAINEQIGKINPGLAQDELHGGEILQSVRSIHLNSDLLYEMRPPGDRRYLYIIGIIALVILLLTVGNYANLAIAMNFGRRREIGMRKVFGAARWQIAGQFILEALLLSLLAVPVVGVLLTWVLPRFDTLMGTEISGTGAQSLSLYGCLFLVSVATGFLASLYPALWLSGLNPLRLFRGERRSTSGDRWSLRHLIVGGQFVLLLGLTSLTFFVNRQLRYLQTRDVGYTKSGILYVSTGGSATRFNALKAELQRLPGVTGVGADGYMGTTSYNQTTYQLDGTPDVFDDAHLVEMDYVSADLLGLRTSVQARIKAPADAPATTALLNTTLADRFQNRYGVDAKELVGRRLVLEPEFTDPENGEVGFPLLVDGTFQDINMFSLRQRVEPMIINLRRDPSYVYWAVVGYQDMSTAAIRDQVGEVFRRLNPETPFVHRFLEENMTELYEAERRVARLSTLFSVVAFVVALLGLVALTAFLTTMRRKEIGIRKILGASDLDLLRHFNRPYLMLLGAAFLVAVPLTYFGISRWLAGFAYRIPLDPFVFVWAALGILMVSLLAVSCITWWEARSWPVQSLRDDQ